MDARLWGRLTLNLLSEAAAEGVYEQVLRHLGDPDVHRQLARFLEEERRQAIGLAQHQRLVGPALPETLVALVRDLGRLAGFGLGLRGGVLPQLVQVERQGERWHAALAERFPAGSLEAQRYKRYGEQDERHIAWLEAYQAHNPPAERREVVEFASIVPAPVEETYAYYRDPANAPALWNLPTALGVGTEVDVVAVQAPAFFVERRRHTPFEHWEHHHHFTPLGAGETLVSDRLFIRPRWLPPVPDLLQPSPWKLALLAMLWWQHRQLQTAFGRFGG